MTCHKYDIFTTRNKGNLDEAIVTCLYVQVSVTGLLVSNRVTYHHHNLLLQTLGKYVQ